MRLRADFFLEGLVSLDRHERADRRGVFRQSLASIARAQPGQSPLEGCDEAALARSICAALADGLLDDLGWLGQQSAGIALYEIAGALPLGVERRELGRMVLERLYGGDAATFVAIAANMAASGAARALAGAGIRARTALVFGLPASCEIRTGPLSMALVAGRELETTWLGAHAIGSLPERRLVAQTLESAAREAAFHHQNDDPIRLFRDTLHGASASRASPETLGGAWHELLSDRESLVWRHVAVARGLLSAALPEFAEEIRTSLGATLSPTEWRRGATSLVASIAVAPDRSLSAAVDLLGGPVLERDAAVATAMLWGLPEAADAEPEAASELLEALSRSSPLMIAEDLGNLRHELGAVADSAARRCATALARALDRTSSDDEFFAFAKRVREDLLAERPRGALESGEARPEMHLKAALEQALDAFVDAGTREAHARAQIALQRAIETLTTLESIVVDAGSVPPSMRSGQRASEIVRTLDHELLASGTLRNLLLLSRGPADQAMGVVPLDEMEESLARWLLASEAQPLPRGSVSTRVGPRARRLRALLHLIDGEATELGDDHDRRARMHGRWTNTCHILFSRLAEERESPLRRAAAATVARALDALVRDGAADPADVLLYAAFRTTTPADFSVLGEASMNPEVWRLLAAYARFVDAESPHEGERCSPSSVVARLNGLTQDLKAGGSQRVEAIRGALTRLVRALSGIQTATALRPLADPETSPLPMLSEALEKLGQLTASALRRCGGEEEPIPVLPSPAFPLTAAVVRVLQAGHDGAGSAGDSTGGALDSMVETTIVRARATLPRAIADLVAAIVPQLGRLPIDPEGGAVRANKAPSEHEAERPLPPWMPSRRTLGGFYVQRPLGGGASGTVFVVTRAEERHDPNAERFALKVPEYDATAARSLSEADFLKLFREEAGALLAVPEHENLARFVTFDVGARPKPILVMELVEGTRCDSLIASRLMTLESAFLLLDGVLAGLSAMHTVGVGHLDIKPSNVLLRASGQTVLVDFGLAGRNIRLGCGTSAYCSPEVWGIVPPSVTPTPMKADIYSFACLAYEVLTGETLFDAPNEVALISAHLTHDGNPPPIRQLTMHPATSALGVLLSRCLRKDPEHRPTALETKQELERVRQRLESTVWPLPA